MLRGAFKVGISVEPELQERGNKFHRCGVQTPSFDLRRKRSEGNREQSYLVPAKAVTGRFAPQRRSLLPRFFGPRLFPGTDLRSPA